MALNSINTNVAAYYAQSNIGKASSAASSSIARLSSGNRIVRASDDVAAMSAGTSLRTNVTTLKRALINASQGSSLLQVADGALSQVTDILQRQKAIAVQAGSGSLRDTERSYLNQEFQNLSAEIDRIATSTNFNNVTLLNGGLGSKTRLVNTDALAALFDPAGAATAGTAVASSTAIQAFKNDGTDASGVAAAGTLDITDSSGTVLADGAYDAVNSAVYGQFSDFKISNVVYGTSATITATLNGVEFSGTYATGTSVLLSNGNTNLNLGLGAAISLTNAGTVQAGQAKLSNDFKDTIIMRTSTIQGVDFAGTRLAGAVGATTTGNAMARLSSANADISNFQYAGNSGAGTNLLTVQINGQTFTASAVADALAAGSIAFQSDDGQSLIVDTTGMTAFTDIRTDKTQQTALINALNTGFSRAGSGLNFAVGSTTSDTLRISLSSASTNSLYNGQTLDVASASSAAAASIALDGAIGKVTSVRAEVGALQSRFDFASANIESAIQNQDAARGVLLDTDVASEATAYATSQVQLQAGISVLAQANQLPQNLLKLLG